VETGDSLYCGVKFCGGCNPRYDRGKALLDLKARFNGKVSFEYVREDGTYDLILVIGGCASCCAAHDEYQVRMGVIKIWDEGDIEDISLKIEQFIGNRIGHDPLPMRFTLFKASYNLLSNRMP